MDKVNSSTYLDAGVNIDEASNLINKIRSIAGATRNIGSIDEIGSFGALYDLSPYKMNQPILVAACDGVGTKLKIAIEMDDYSQIGIDLVAMSINDLLVQGARPLFFLDYYATGKLETPIAERIIQSIADGCKISGCALIGGETA